VSFCAPVVLHFLDNAVPKLTSFLFEVSIYKQVCKNICYFNNSFDKTLYK